LGPILRWPRTGQVLDPRRRPGRGPSRL